MKGGVMKRKLAALAVGVVAVLGGVRPASAWVVTPTKYQFSAVFNSYRYTATESDSSRYINMYNGNGNYIGQVWGNSQTTVCNGSSNGYYREYSIYTGVQTAFGYFNYSQTVSYAPWC